MSHHPFFHESLTGSVAAIGDLPGVVGIALGGSVAAGFADESSDLDLHVYWRAPLADSHIRAERLRAITDPGNEVREERRWGLEDHFRLGGRLVELIYVDLDDLLRDVDHAYESGLDGEGFVTARLYYLAEGRLLHDPTGELAALRERLTAYPEPTRQQVLRSNPALLRAYLQQVRTAHRRGDLLFVQHRRYSVQMVFFNLLFALNRRYHPGEKRLLRHAERCRLQPADTATRWNALARLPADDPALPDALESLAHDLIALAEAAD